MMNKQAPMKKPTPPVPRCNSRQMNRALLFYAVVGSLELIMDDIPERLQAAGIAEELRAYTDQLVNMANRLTDTYPPEEVEAMRKQQKRLYIELETHNVMGGYEGHTWMKVRTLDAIIKAAYSCDGCMLCLKPDKCSTCSLGKAFDSCLPDHRMPGESWQNINVFEGME